MQIDEAICRVQVPYGSPAAVSSPPRCPLRSPIEPVNLSPEPIAHRSNQPPHLHNPPITSPSNPLTFKKKYKPLLPFPADPFYMGEKGPAPQ